MASARGETRGSAQGSHRASDIDDLIDEASMESFPASDPPSYWARDADDLYVTTKRDEAGSAEEEAT